MDPNAALARIRELILKGDTYEVHEDFYELSELVAALDNWITNGGFFPKDWMPF
jgi:hypothetical protein